MKEREKNKPKRIKREQGITLIALVITIIILIILATVTIALVFSEGGLIQRAQESKELTEQAQIEEQDELKGAEEYINGVLTETGTTDSTEGKWDLSKVNPVESADGIIVPVPIGYTASEVTGENAVKNGFVIYENTNGQEGKEPVTDDSDIETAQKTRNQFVWVPVTDINQIANQTNGVDRNGRQNYQGKLYDFTSTGATEKKEYGQGTDDDREPDIAKKYDGIDATYPSYFEEIISSTMTGEEFKTQMQEDFNAMIASVKIYGGFYIGRYETGNLSSNTSTEPVVVKANNRNASNGNWYYVYQCSKLIKANDNVVTTMVWGCMWDRTLIWLTETGNKTYDELKNSTSWGNYPNSVGDAAINSGSKKSTGTSEIWKANNIYDLAGNASECTLTNDWGDGLRVTRGGACGSGWGTSASGASNVSPYHFHGLDGSRSALYIK